MVIEITLGLGALLQVAQFVWKEGVEYVKRKQQLQKEEVELKQSIDQFFNRFFEMVELIKGVLQDATNKQEQPAVFSWLQKLNGVLYDAQDVLQEYATDIKLQAMVEVFGPAHSAQNEQKSWFASKKTAKGMPANITLSDLYNKIKSVNEKFDSLLKTRAGLGLQVLDKSDSRCKSLVNNLQWRETTSIIDADSHVEGRDDVRIKIIKELLARKIDLERDGQALSNTKNNSSSNNYYHTQYNVDFSNETFLVIPVVGVAGVGKTTMAQLVFNDDDVKSHFSIRVWVYVSHDFDVFCITEKILDSIYSLQGITEIRKRTSLDNMHNELLRLVEAQNFLLVLDDAWNENSERWDKLFTPLRAARSGSQRVIITTRDMNIAAGIKRCSEPVILECLDEESSWKIFCRNLFGGSMHNFAALEPIGKQIIKRLKGSPLALKFVTRVLSKDRTVEHWNKILHSNLWEFQGDDNELFSSLQLSYLCLPAHLQRCLFYLSIFPKDYEFEDNQIVYLWRAQDCIQCESDMLIEDTGKMYLKKLAEKFFLQSIFDNSRCQRRTCPQKYVFHHLFHDLVASVPENDCYCITDDYKKKSLPKGSRHLSLFSKWGTSGSMYQKVCHDIFNYEKLRTLVFNPLQPFGAASFGLINDDYVGRLFTKLRCLRTLVLKGCPIKVLPESISNLKLLHVLDLSASSIEQLPESIWCLHNLLVFNLDGCYNLKRLPSSTTRLVNLRHFIVDFCRQVSPVKGIGRLTMLQGLSYFSVGEEEGFSIGELKDLNELRGRLEIGRLELVKGQEEAQSAQLDKKVHLEEIRFKWGNETTNGTEKSDRSGCEHERVLERLKPSGFLKQLCINDYKGVIAPSWLADCSSTLRMLDSIKLEGCTKMEVLPPALGKLPSLKKLEISGMDSLRMIIWHCSAGLDSDATLFPVLEMLAFDHMPAWVEWRVEMLGKTEQEREEEEEEEEEQTTGRATDGRDNFSCLPQLRCLSIEHCPMLDSVFLPPLAALKDLTVMAVGSRAFRRGFRKFPSLEGLLLWNLDWETRKPGRRRLRRTQKQDPLPVPRGIADAGTAPSSHDVCSSKGGSGPLPPSLRRLCIDNCSHVDSGILSRYLCGLVALRELTISRCRSLVSLHLPTCMTTLKKLVIQECEALSFMGFQCSILLDSLRICRCPNLFTGTTHSSPAPSPTSSVDSRLLSPLLKVKSLEVDNCSMHQLTRLLTEVANPVHLEELCIRECLDAEVINGTALDVAFRGLISLTTLHVSQCQRLRSLPFGIYSSFLLKDVLVVGCPLLSALPDMKPFIHMRSLQVYGCWPQLVERYRVKDDINPYWQRISHIPQVVIDS